MKCPILLNAVIFLSKQHISDKGKGWNDFFFFFFDGKPVTLWFALHPG